MPSLLERAQGVKDDTSYTRAKYMDHDHVELALAWARDEVTSKQAATAMGTTRQNAPFQMMSAIRWALRTGMLYVNLKPAPNGKKSK
jgi:hypothetical protein